MKTLQRTLTLGMLALTWSTGCIPLVDVDPTPVDVIENDDQQNDLDPQPDNGNVEQPDGDIGEEDVDLTPRFVIDRDNNNADNPLVQPVDPALSGGGRDQSLRNGAVLFGSARRDVMVGGLGQDTFIANDGPDVMIGGPEHFSPGERNDRALGGRGNDLFLWSPGDASDFYDGGEGIDALAFGLLGEIENGLTVFRVSRDGLAGEVFFDPNDGLPRMDVTNSPGFCTIVDGSTDEDAAALDALNLDHLARFALRGPADAFDAGANADDDGTRVTLHLRNVEFVICASRAGGEIEVLDLRTTPPTLTTLDEVSSEIPGLEQMIR